MPITGPRAKGSTVQSTLAFIADTFGEPVSTEVLHALEPHDRTVVAALGSTDELPYALVVRVWETANHVVLLHAPEALHWAEQAGAASIGSYGVQLYGGILRKPSPLEFLTQSISLFRLYYQPGDMQVVENAPGRVVLRLVGFDPVTTLFCRRQVGGLRQAITLAGGGHAHVRHVRCAIEGDAFCEWELHWQVESIGVSGGATATGSEPLPGARGAGAGRAP
ncbi:hypothetical protein [Gemmatimonas phototrophica]|uniref:Heme NO-binding domain-containing protein n=1 Tax=Gemmatimonas phototrophica TaxID=1379270 RepID=A0A143BJK5_9BACT|nr:hypothetical protein [Gemmatimonas phototrophica]AMW05208.1 hypothetical protein GEMMAAP_11080 [Gemmatimonas phototrophica]